MQPLISVVMPVYGVEKYLSDAVTSVCRQSEADWELILVDDASPDGCGAICDRFAAQDRRISVIHLTENGGLSNARNTGLQQASGKYVMFMDSDDRIDISLFGKLKKAVDCENAPQMIVWGAAEEHYGADGTLIERREVCMQENVCHTARQVRVCALALEQKTLLGYAWNKLYERELLLKNNIRFEKVQLIEDIVFNLQVLPHVERMQVLPDALYFYARRTEGSLTHRFIPDYYALSMRRVREMLDLYEEWNMGTEAKKVLAPIYVRYALSALSRNCDKLAKMTCKERLSFVQKMRKSQLHCCLKEEMKHIGGVTGLLAKLIAWGNGASCLLMGRGIYMVQYGMKGLFLKLSRKEDI